MPAEQIVTDVIAAMLPHATAQVNAASTVLDAYQAGGGLVTRQVQALVESIRASMHVEDVLMRVCDDITENIPAEPDFVVNLD